MQSFRSYSTIEEKYEVTLGTRLAFPATKKYSVEIAYIYRYKTLQYTFDKSAEKIDGRIVVPSPMSTLAISSASLNIFFLKLSTTVFPLYLPVVRAKQVGRSR